MATTQAPPRKTKPKSSVMAASRCASVARLAEAPTLEEIFKWVCDKQGIKKPENLPDGRWYGLQQTAAIAHSKMLIHLYGASPLDRTDTEARRQENEYAHSAGAHRR